MQTHEIKPITTTEEHQDATKRIAELAGSYFGAEENDELKARVAAVKKWNFDHADATAQRTSAMWQPLSHSRI